jgi:hypothetical protein
MARNFSIRIGEGEGGGRIFVSSSFVSASRFLGVVEGLTTLDRVPGCGEWWHLCVFPLQKGSRIVEGGKAVLSMLRKMMSIRKVFEASLGHASTSAQPSVNRLSSLKR